RAKQYDLTGVLTQRKIGYDAAIDLYARAAADETKAIALKPDYAEAYEGRGNALAHRGYGMQAIDDYTKLIGLKPNYARAYAERGNVYKEIRKNDAHDKAAFDRAIADYTKAIALDPKNAENFIQRGDTYEHEKLHDRAIADYTKAIALKPSSTAYMDRSAAYSAKGDDAKAQADTDKFLALYRAETAEPAKP
ncbi:MAG: hypothetical protein ACREFC_05350, partial [Stellaceae bacterium]